MTQNKVQIGHHAVLIDSPAVAGTIQDSFNNVTRSEVSDEIKSALADLHTAVAELSKRLPPDKAKQVAGDLGVLAREATSPSPRREWYDISAKGLKEAAAAVADIGPTVIACVQKIAGLLGL